MTDQGNARLRTGKGATNVKSRIDDNNKSIPEDNENEVPEVVKESKFNPSDPSSIFFILVWLGMFVKICFYLMTRTTPTEPPTAGEYFASITKMKELARLEQLLIAKMNAVVADYHMTKLESYSSGDLWLNQLLKIERYLHDYESSIQPMLSETTNIEETVVSHPLISFRMLRRVAINLPDIIQYNVEGRFNDLANVAAMIQPAVTMDDVVGAVEGILRLQATFLISPSDFADGRLHNYDTNSGLTGSILRRYYEDSALKCYLRIIKSRVISEFTDMDCFLIGNTAITALEQYSTAVEWLVQSLRMLLRVFETNNDTIEAIRRSLQNAIEMHNRGVGRLPWTFNKAIDIKFSEMTKDNENELMKTFPSHPPPPPYQLLGKAVDDTFDDNNFKGLCRGDRLRNETLTKRLKCYYKRDNPFLAIKPLKVEVHSYKPLILQFYDIMPDYIINHFKTTTSHQLERALVYSNIIGSPSGIIPSSIRISCSYFTDEKTDEIFSRVPKIVHEATGLNLLPDGSAESSQISTYGPIGGYYIYHYDNIFDSRYTAFHLLDPEDRSRGDRIATIMFYLSDLKLGGGTAFPKIGVLAEPIKGSAIFWYNLKKNGERHPLSLHGGCPVLLGEKWVINKWVRSSDQMFLRKCSLDSNK